LGEQLDVPLQVGQVGTMFGFYLLKAPGVKVTSWAEAKQWADPARFARLFWALCERGVYLAPSQYEAGFVSAAHTPADIAQTLAAFSEALQA